MIHRNSNKRQLIYNQLLELDRHDILVGIGKLHFDFQQCKWHSLRMQIRRKHCSKCESIDCKVVWVDSRYCKHKARSGIRQSCCMDRRYVDQLDIDIWRCDYSRHKWLVGRNSRLHRLGDIPSCHFGRFVYISHFLDIQRLTNIGFVVPIGNRYDLLDCRNILANIGIHYKKN